MGQLDAMEVFEFELETPSIRFGLRKVQIENSLNRLGIALDMRETGIDPSHMEAQSMIENIQEHVDDLKELFIH